MENQGNGPTKRTALLSGGMAGLSVDICLFPLDTLKTRLQSAQGFIAAGGFRNIYSGLGPVVLGSAPGAAFFFLTYETVKSSLQKLSKSGDQNQNQWHHHMLAASCGEVTACFVRVPVEIIKQRRQAFSPDGTSKTSLQILTTTLKEEGFVRGLYRGYGTTLLREIPFSLIQFPLWEWLKFNLHHKYLGHAPDPWQSSICGAVAGGVSAAVTTPLDVAKTRIMLAPANTHLAVENSTAYALKVIFAEKGVRGLFAGVVPRVMWITIGGGIFFGVYEQTKVLVS